jgi:hypothetical protein
MDYSPFADLWRILSTIHEIFIVFLLVVTTPILTTYLISKKFKRRPIYYASISATIITMFFSLIWLSTLGPPAGLSPVGILLIPFLMLYIPVWGIILFSIWLFLQILHKPADAT